MNKEDKYYKIKILNQPYGHEWIRIHVTNEGVKFKLRSENGASHFSLDMLHDPRIKDFLKDKSFQLFPSIPIHDYINF